MAIKLPPFGQQQNLQTFEGNKGVITLPKFQSWQSPQQPTTFTPTQAPSAVQNFPGTVNTLSELQSNPMSTGKTGNFFGDLWDAIKNPIVNEWKNINNAADSANPAQAISNSGKVLAGAGNIVLSPLSAVFSAGNDLPIIGTVSRLITLPFNAIGDTVPHITNAIVDEIPGLSQQTKDQLKPGISDLATLAAQIYAGKAMDVAGEKFLPSERAATTFRNDFVKANPSYADSISQIGTNKLNKLVKEHGTQDAITIVKSAIDIAKEKQGLPPLETKPVDNTAPNIQSPIPTEQPVAQPNQIQLPSFQNRETANVGTNINPAADVAPTMPSGTGEMKTSGLASTLQSNALANDIQANFGDLPQYQGRDMKTVAPMAENFVAKNIDSAKRIINGEEHPPQGLLVGDVYSALKRKAVQEGDVATLLQLKDAKANDIATAYGQNVQAFNSGLENDPVSAMKDIQKAREDAVKAKYKDINKAKSIVAEQIRNEIRKTSPTKQTWSDFVDSIQC